MESDEKSRLVNQIKEDAKTSLRHMSDKRQDFYSRVIGKIESFETKTSEHEGTRLKLRALQKEIMHSIDDLREYWDSKDVTSYLNALK